MLCTSNNSKRQSFYYCKATEDGELPFERNSGDNAALGGRKRIVADDRRGSIYVELTKKEGCGLGLVLCGGLDKPNKPQISYLRPGGIAQRSDALEVGDYIISVNGIRTALLRHDEIVNLLKNAGRTVILEVEYELPDEPQSSFSVQQKHVEVRLEKDGDTFGFTLRGGSQASPDKCRPLTVTQIRPGSSADREGTLKVGDRILAISGINTVQSNLSVVLAILKNAEDEIHLLVEYDVSIIDVVQNACGPLLVEIDKTPGTNLGVFLTTTTYKGKSVICIESIKPASIADRCGALHIGDHLLGIDETNLEHMGVAEAMQLLRCGSSEHIKLEILPMRKQRSKSSDLVMRSALLAPPHPPNPSRSCSSLQSIGAYTYGPLLNAITHAPSGGEFGSSDSQRTGWPTLINRGSANSLSSSQPSPVSQPNSMSHAQLTDVVLVADHHGFGFSLQGGTHLSDGLVSPPVISRVEPRGAAERSGAIQEGDRVLAINGQSLENLSLEQVHQVLRDAGLQVTLRIEFDVADTVITSTGTFTVKLAKRGSTLGITISAPSQRKPGEPLIISDVKRASVAHRTGTIQPGDRLLAIDGVRTDDCTIEDAAHLLQQAQQVVKLKIRKDETYSEEPDPSTSITYTVELPKMGGPLGITVSGTEDPFDPIFISGLCEGGLAEKTGALHVGDRILAINNESLQGRPLSDAIMLLQMAGDKVLLKISRPTNQRNRNGVAGKSHDSMDSALGSWDSSGMDNNNIMGRLTSKDKTQDTVAEGSCNSSLKDEVDTAVATKPSTQHHQHNLWSGDQDEWSLQLGKQQQQQLGDLCVNTETVPDAQLQIVTDTAQVHAPNTHSETDEDEEEEQPQQPREKAVDTVADIHVVQVSANGVTDCMPPADRQDDVDPDTTIVTYELEANDPAEINTDADDCSSKASSKATAAEIQLKEVEEQLQNIFTPTPVELMRVTLQKSGSGDDFGFGLSDGVYEKGVYISALRPGSAADRCGMLRQYDRVLQVNNVKTKELDCAQVVPMIAASGDEIDLVISRNPLAAFEHLQHESWQLTTLPNNTTVYGHDI